MLSYLWKPLPWSTSWAFTQCVLLLALQFQVLCLSVSFILCWFLSVIWWESNFILLNLDYLISPTIFIEQKIFSPLSILWLIKVQCFVIFHTKIFHFPSEVFSLSDICAFRASLNEIIYLISFSDILLLTYINIADFICCFCILQCHWISKKRYQTDCSFSFHCERTQQDLEARKKALTNTKPYWNLHPGFPASRAMRNFFFLLKPYNLQCFTMIAWED